jgi:hypothetical protein
MCPYVHWECQAGLSAWTIILDNTPTSSVSARERFVQQGFVQAYPQLSASKPKMSRRAAIWYSYSKVAAVVKPVCGSGL